MGELPSVGSNAAQGYPLTLIGNATNAEASGKAMVDDAVEYVAR